MDLILGISAVFLLATGASAWLMWRLLRCGPVEPVDREWLETFSVSRYLPLERLLSEDDFRFLKSEPGFQPGIARRLRWQRRRVFLAYLRQLRLDFERLHGMARLLLLYSPDQRPDLASSLLRSRVSFYLALAKVYCQFLLSLVGARGIHVHGIIQAVRLLHRRIVSASV